MFGFWGCGCKDIHQIQKDIPPKKVFGNSEFCSSRQNPSRPNKLKNCGFGGKNKTQSFQKLFWGGYLFVSVQYLCNCSPKIKTKNTKNYSSILAIILNHQNWLDDSTPLKSSHDPVRRSYDSLFSYLYIKHANICQQNVDKSATTYVFSITTKNKNCTQFFFCMIKVK